MQQRMPSALETFLLVAYWPMRLVIIILCHQEIREIIVQRDYVVQTVVQCNVPFFRECFWCVGKTTLN
jgi:hypothetical protein